ncbi:MAG: hypothetical protein ABFC63_01720 [Thermoguttaceae bacterium]
MTLPRTTNPCEGRHPRQRPIVLSAFLLLVAIGCQTVVGQNLAAPGKTPAASSGHSAATPSEKPEAADPNERPLQPEAGCEELPVDKNQAKNNSAISEILIRGQFTPGNQPMFDDFFTKYFLAQWTQWENVSKLPDLRRKLQVSYLGRKSNGAEVHDHLNTLVLDFMKKLVAGSYYRAVRVNAMLMIGQLNSVEPSTPMPEALKVLVTAAESQKLPDALRIAAMIGVLRHAAVVRDEDSRKLIAAAMLHIAGNELPAGPSAAGRQWLLGQALKTLGVLGSPGEADALFKTLLGAVENTKLAVCTRTIAADSIGRLNYSGAQINVVDTSSALGRLAADACSDELRLANSDSNAISRARLKLRCDTVIAAAKSMIDLAKEPPHQAWIGELVKAVKTVADAADDARRSADDVKTAVEGLPKNVETWLEKKPK